MNLLVTTIVRKDGQDVQGKGFVFPLTPGSTFDASEARLMGCPFGSLGDTSFYEDSRPDDQILLASVSDSDCEITPKWNAVFSKGTVLLAGNPREMGVVLPLFAKASSGIASDNYFAHFVSLQGEGVVCVGDSGQATATNTPGHNDALAIAGNGGIAIASGGAVPSASAGVGGVAIAEGNWGLVFVPMGKPKACGEVRGRSGYVRVRPAPEGQEGSTVSPIVILRTWWGKTKVFNDLTPGLWRLNWRGKPVCVKVD